uniref:Cytochrome c oxidase polypeptide VIIc n=1 Tax=Hydatigena taeniaeformis TaxID=6205 RepID=A0A0R3X8N8_HYDTA
LSRAGVPAIPLSSPSVLLSRSILTRPAFVQKLYDRLDAAERSIDEEGKPGTNLPFDTKNPRRLALTMILFIGIAFNIPFFITYSQMKAAKSG